MEMIQARREWQEIFQVMKTRSLQPRLLYPARLSIKIESKIRSFPGKRSLKEYTSSKLFLQDMLTGRGTESQNWRSHGGLLGGGRMREKVQGLRSLNGRYKIDRGKLRIV